MNYFKIFVRSILEDEAARRLYAEKIRASAERIMERRPELAPALEPSELEVMLEGGIGQMLESPEEAHVDDWMARCLELRRERLEDDEASREVGHAGGIRVK